MTISDIINTGWSEERVATIATDIEKNDGVIVKKGSWKVDMKCGIEQYMT